ncbi:hypothetical protein, partial [Vibrio vulnificus]|uniref:hypothetical protein n=1 Tax=Vibrio vulnificus TaxID=672 RepID=UPI0039B3B445
MAVDDTLSTCGDCERERERERERRRIISGYLFLLVFVFFWVEVFNPGGWFGSVVAVAVAHRTHSHKSF